MARGRRIDRIFYELGVEVDDFQKGINNAEKSAGRLSSIIQKHPIASAGALSAALVGVGIKAASMASDLEQAMAKVSTQLSGGKDEAAAFRAELTQLFRELPIADVNELAAGLYELLSSGIAASDAMDTLRVAAKAAVAGDTSVEVAVKGIAGALNAFSSSGITAQQVADQFTSAVDAGTGSFAEIGTEIGRVAGLASSLNISLADLLTPMTALTLRNVSVSEGFTAIRAALTNILKPTAEFKEKFPALANEFNRARLEGTGLTQFLIDLASSMKDHGDEAINSMFGSVNAFNAVLSLTKDGGNQVQQLFNDISNSAGKTDEAYEKMASTTKALWQVTKNQLTASLLELGNLILPTVNKGLQVMLGLLQSITGAQVKDRVTVQMAGLADTVDEEVKRIDEALAKLDATSSQRSLTSAEAKTRGDLTKQRGDELRKVRVALGGILGGAGLARAMTQEVIDKLSTAQLNAVKVGLETLLKHDTLSWQQEKVAKMNIARATAWLKARGASESPVQPTTPETPDGSGGGRPTGLSADEKKRLEERLKKQREMTERAKDYAVKATASLIDDLELELERFEKEVVSIFGSLAQAPEIVATQWAGIQERLATAKSLEPLQKELDKLTEKSQDAEEALKIGITGPSEEVLESYDTLIGRIRAQMLMTKADGAEWKALDQILKDTTHSREALSRAMIEATPTKVDDIEAEILALERLAAKYDAIPEDIRVALASAKQRLASVKILEPLQKQLKEFSERAEEALFELTHNKNRAPLRALILDYKLLINAKETKLETLDKESQAYKDLAKEVRALKLELKGLIETQDKTSEGAALRERAREIEDIARNVLKLSEAFGILDQESARALENIVQIAANIPGALAGNFGSITSVLAGIASLGKSIFGKSDKQKRREQQIRDNKESLESLRRTRGEFGLDITGTQMSGITQVISAVVNRGANLYKELEKNSLVMEDLWKVAGELGIELNANKESYKQFLEALKQTELTQFANTFVGQMTAMMAQFDLFDITDPIDQMKELTTVFSNPQFGSPALRKALAGIDLSTPEGRQKAEEAIQSLFRQLQRGTLSAEALGGLTPQEFLQALLQLETLIDQANQADPTGVNQSFGISRTITEITGSRIASVLTSISTHTAWLETIANEVQTANELLRQFVVPRIGISPPRLPADFGISATGDTNISVTIHIDTVSGSNTQDIAEKIAAQVASQVDAILGNKLRQQRIHRGALVS